MACRDREKRTASYSIANGVTKVDLHLQPNDAVFVVFKEQSNKTIC